MVNAKNATNKETLDIDRIAKKVFNTNGNNRHTQTTDQISKEIENKQKN